MLSVGSRDGGGKGLGLGFGGGGGMEENELEEGEAFSGNDDESCFDPDIALSYIDEKLQDVLGHFQKDFEGGVSAENLGAKYGGYGSFLPSYQRSPSVWLQPKSPIGGSNHNASRSPYNSSSEGARQNPQVPTGTSVSKNNCAPTSQSVDIYGKPPAAKFSAGEPVPRHDSFNKPANGNSDQKTLKVRIKVGPNNSLATNNAAIYSGLGLDTPSPSMEDSPGGSGGELSPDLQLVPDESPMTILQIMTCFSVPGGYLLSPLPDSVLHLTKRETAFLKNGKTDVLPKDIRETYAVVADMLPSKDAKGLIEKKIKLDEKSSWIVEAHNSGSKDEISTILNRDIDSETPEGQKLISEALNISILSGSRSTDLKTERQVSGDLVVANRVADLSKQPNRIPWKDRIYSPDQEQDHQLESTESIKHNGTHSGNETTYSRGKPNNNMILEEKLMEERKTSNLNDTTGDISREGTFKVENNYDSVKSNSVGYKTRKNHTAITAEPPNSVSAQKVASYEQGEGILQRKDQLSVGKRNIKGSSTTAPPAVELTMENPPAVSCVKSKVKKKSSHARRDLSENKTRGPKSRKEVSKGRSRESRGVVASDANAEPMQYRTDLMETNDRKRPNDANPEQKKASFACTEKSNDRPAVKKVDNPPAYQAVVDAPVNAPSVTNAPSSNAAGALQAPVVIKEHWVACDICQKWRLLPYGTDTSYLPNKWQCSMQIWLPELNKCHISEAVTTKALNALYQIPVPESGANLNIGHEVDVSTINPADVLHFDQRLGHNMQSVPTVVKTKQGSKDESNVLTSAKSRSVSDVNKYPSETNLSSKIRHTSKSSDFAIEKHKHKQKEKHKILGRYSDGGDIIENNGKHSKSKSKREADQDDLRISKKSKKEGAIEDPHSNLNVAGRDPLSTDNGFASKAIGKYSQKHVDSSFKELKCDPKGHLPASIKKRDEINAFSSGDLKDNFSASDVEKTDTVAISAKKRKVKEWQASQSLQENQVSSRHTPDDSVIMKEDFSDSQRRKQKMAKLAKSDGKESGTSKREGKMEKGCSTRILLSGSKEHPPDGMDVVRGVAGKEQLGKDQGNAASRRSLDCTNYSKKDLAYTQPPAGATSSSSKISGSRKSKANLQEARGSPVESVSSSPLRISNIEKLSSRRKSAAKDGVINGGFSITGSPKRCSDFEIDVASDWSGIRRKETAASIQQRSLESQRAAESGVLDSLRGPRSNNYDAQEEDERNQLGKKDTTVKWFTSGKKDANSSNGKQDNMAGPSMFSKQHKDFDSRIMGASCSKSSLQENLQQVPPQWDDKSSSHFLSDRDGHLEITSGRGKSQSIPSSKDKQVQTRGPQSIPTLTKGSRSEGCPIDAVNSDAPKVVKQSKRPESQNGPRHATPSGLDASSPIRKDGHPAANIVLREARDLKHTANRLKSEGLELESTGLYFEAALKFLHVASLWEPTNLENAKHGDAVQSIQMYSDTARLCEFCAHEYEKWKEMASAALAYKCVEVAYMKVAYFKHPSASKDRHELQAALRLVPPGESPSSSASDVDNLNNQGALDKAASVKGTASPQIAGSHVIAARNRPNFLRLLKYMNDLNCAFEATRKSQNAIAAAITNLGKDGVDGMPSVKRALDFNFHNVEGLLRLVRLSMESISQ